MSQSSSLASVVGSHPDDLAKWTLRLISGRDALSQLHKKFWGISMADEERDWHVADSRDRSKDDVQSCVGQDEGMDDGSMSEDESMDDAGNMDGASDIVPGCYVLELGIAEILRRPIWIRGEYISIFDYFETFYTETIDHLETPAAVLTGQAGIGKSTWQYYALRRCLACKKPVIWYHNQCCYLFVEEGVYQLPAGPLKDRFKTIVWTLVDSDESKEGVPDYLVSRGTSLFVIYSTSPARERWSRIHKTVRETIVIMNPWSKAEIYRAAPLQLRDPDFGLISDVYDQLGPVPRICFDDIRTRLELQAYHAVIDDMMEELKAVQFKKLIGTTRNLAMDDASHKICLIRRMNDAITHANRITVSAMVQVMPITQCIESKLALQFRNLERREQVEIYRRFAPFPTSRGMTGNVFEGYCQKIFQRKISIECIPMVRLPDSEPLRKPSQKKRKVSQRAIDEKSTYKYQWHSSHVVLANGQLEEKRLAALRNKISLHVCPSTTHEYREIDLKTANVLPDVYYIPRKSNQVAVDSFIIHDGILWLFQFASGKGHKVKDGLVKLLEECAGLPPRENWRFIFIMPDDSDLLKCPAHLHPWLQKLPLFTSMVALQDD